MSNIQTEDSEQNCGQTPSLDPSPVSAAESPGRDSAGPAAKQKERDRETLLSIKADCICYSTAILCSSVFCGRSKTKISKLRIVSQWQPRVTVDQSISVNSSCGAATNPDTRCEDNTRQGKARKS